MYIFSKFYLIQILHLKIKPREYESYIKLFQKILSWYLNVDFDF